MSEQSACPENLDMPRVQQLQQRRSELHACVEAYKEQSEAKKSEIADLMFKDDRSSKIKLHKAQGSLQTMFIQMAEWGVEIDEVSSALTDLLNGVSKAQDETITKMSDQLSDMSYCPQAEHPGWINPDCNEDGDACAECPALYFSGGGIAATGVEQENDYQ